MNHEEAQTFTPVESASGAPAGARQRRDVTQKTLLGFTLGALGLALLAFLFGLNSIIETWLRPQWVPIARTGMALVVILVCLYVLRLLTRAQGSRST